MTLCVQLQLFHFILDFVLYCCHTNFEHTHRFRFLRMSHIDNVSISVVGCCDCSRKSGLVQWRWMVTLRHLYSVQMVTDCFHTVVRSSSYWFFSLDVIYVTVAAYFCCTYVYMQWLV